MCVLLTCFDMISVSVRDLCLGHSGDDFFCDDFFGDESFGDERWLL